MCITLTQCCGSIFKLDAAPAEIEETKRLSQYHCVKKGENLPEVAKKYKMSVKELAYLNQLKVNAQLYKGQRLHVHKRDFETYSMIPIVETKSKEKAFTDYNVDKKRTQASLAHHQKNQHKYKTAKNFLLLPAIGLAALGIGAWKLAKNVTDKTPKLTLGGGSRDATSNTPGDRGEGGFGPSFPPYAGPNGNSDNNDDGLPIIRLNAADKSTSAGENARRHNGGNGQNIGITPPYAGPLEDTASGSDPLPPSTVAGAGSNLLKIGAGLAGGGGALGLGLFGLKMLMDKSKLNQSSIDKEVYHGQMCARVSFGWPLNYQRRIFSYVDPNNKEAGIWIKNTQRELFVVPALPGKIIDVQQPNEHEDRYIIVIKHKCNNLATIYGNIRIPSEEKIKPENLRGLYVTKADAIGLIDPDKPLYFCVKQIQAGKDANSINYEFQDIAKQTARTVKYEKCAGNKVDIGGLSFGIQGSTRKEHKILTINNKQVSEIYFIDPMVYLPQTPPMV